MHSVAKFSRSGIAKSSPIMIPYVQGRWFRNITEYRPSESDSRKHRNIQGWKDWANSYPVTQPQPQSRVWSCGAGTEAQQTEMDTRRDTGGVLV